MSEKNLNSFYSSNDCVDLISAQSSKTLEPNQNLNKPEYPVYEEGDKNKINSLVYSQSSKQSEESQSPFDSKENIESILTYALEETWAVLNGCYDPRNFFKKYKPDENKFSVERKHNQRQHKKSSQLKQYC